MSSKSKRKPKDVSMHKAVVHRHDDLRLGMDVLLPPHAGGRKQAVGRGGEHPGERRKRQSQRLDGQRRHKGRVRVGNINRPAVNKNAAQRV